MDGKEEGTEQCHTIMATSTISIPTGGCVLYKAIGTHFPELVKNSGDMAIIYAQRLSVDSCAIYAVHNYNGTIHTKEVYNSGLFSIASNTVGTISILYNNASLNVYCVAIKY